MRAFLMEQLRGVVSFMVIFAFLVIVMFAMAAEDFDTLSYYLIYAVVSISIGLIFGIRAYMTLRSHGIDHYLPITGALSVLIIVPPLAAVTLSSIGSWAQRGMEHFGENSASQVGLADQTLGLILFIMACGILASGWFTLGLLADEIVKKVVDSHQQQGEGADSN